MDEQTFQEALLELFEHLQDAAAGDEYPNDLPREFAGIRNVVSFEACQMLTRNAGVVLTMDDGSEFQVTIVQNRPARRNASAGDEEDN